MSSDIHVYVQFSKRIKSQFDNFVDILALVPPSVKESVLVLQIPMRRRITPENPQQDIEILGDIRERRGFDIQRSHQEQLGDYCFCCIVTIQK